jgi:hypothetical protein
MKVRVSCVGVFSILAIAALSTSLWGYLWRDKPKAPLIVQPSSQALGGIHPDEKRRLSFNVINSASVAVDILGAYAGCGPGGCAAPEGWGAMQIPARSSKVLVVEFKGGQRTGPFSYPLHLYVNWPSQSEIVLMITGTVVSNESSHESSVSKNSQ